MSDIDLASRPALAKNVRLQMDKVTGQTVLLYPEGVLELNPTAEAILHCCDGKTSLAAILEALAAEYDAPPDELRGDVLDCVAELRARNFLVFAP